MAGFGRVSKLLSPSEAKALKASERRMARESMDVDPNLAEELAALKKKEKSSELTAREERRLDQLMSQRIREGGAEKPEGMSRIMKNRGLSEKEKKELQQSLEYKKGGMVKKPAKKMMGGGMAKPKMYNKGGMANCGASMKPAQKAKK
jgi:hypothetical protein